MNGLNLIVLAALLLWGPAAAAPAPAPGGLGEGEPELAELCSRRPLDLDGLLADSRARKGLDRVAPEDALDLEYYGACRALQGKDGCAALKSLGGPLANAERTCRGFEARARMARLLVRGEDAFSACRAMLEVEGKSGAPAERGCRAFLAAAPSGDALSACPEIERSGLIGPGESCRDFLAYWAGRPQACAAIADAARRRDCAEASALVAGLRQGSACGGSWACQALQQKSPEACLGLRRSFSSAVCARVDQTATAARRQAELQRKAEGAEKLIATERQRKEKAEAEVAVKASREDRRNAEARAQVEAKAKAAKAQFKKGEAMQKQPPDVEEAIRRVEKGLPPLPPKTPSPPPPQAPLPPGPPPPGPPGGSDAPTERK